MADQVAGEDVLEHIKPKERDKFEKKHGVTWCRRCGRMIVNDKNPEGITKKPCEVVKIELRGRMLDPHG